MIKHLKEEWQSWDCILGEISHIFILNVVLGPGAFLITIQGYAADCPSSEVDKIKIIILKYVGCFKVICKYKNE